MGQGPRDLVSGRWLKAIGAFSARIHSPAPLASPLAISFGKRSLSQSWEKEGCGPESSSPNTTSLEVAEAVICVRDPASRADTEVASAWDAPVVRG